jgi:GntR family transcriptional regulator, transcriptional repressor for pyruvate dehydrogenase complex
MLRYQVDPVSSMSKAKSAPPASTRPRSRASEPPPDSSRRALAADPVFESLAGAILRGKFAPNSPLPPERDLAALFNVSRLIVRQALHRLKEIGLVRVRQGGQTIALDPEESTDPRLVALTMELAPERAHEQDVFERQLLAGAMLIELAELRAGARALDALDTRFWVALARATGNRVLLRETRWWFDLMQKQPERRRKMYGRPELRMALYRGVIDHLRARSGAAQFYVKAIKSLLERPR